MPKNGKTKFASSCWMLDIFVSRQARRRKVQHPREANYAYNSGITLVALIITIIILIILAGITLNIAIGKNGILQKSKEAVDKYKDAADTEDSILAQMDKQMKGLEYSTPWTRTTDTIWYNDTDTEFTITTAEQLAGFAELVNAGNTFEGKTVKLGQSIDLGATWDEEGNLISGTETEWTPIGTWNTIFQGTFDGDNYSIKNLYFTDKEGNDDTYGLFKQNKGTIQNVTIESGYVYGNNSGGICGYSYTGSSIINCHNKAEISGEYIIGGILGYGNGEILRCSNYGKIQCSAEESGGIIGEAADVKIKYCYNYGYIKGRDHVGGICGSWNDVYNPEISYCYNISNIVGIDGNYIGNIVGAGVDLNLTKCYYYEESEYTGAGEFSDTEGKLESTTDKLNSFEEFLVWIKNR